jgi:hypothetical protein
MHVGFAILYASGGTEVNHSMGKFQINLDTYDINSRRRYDLYMPTTNLA